MFGFFKSRKQKELSRYLSKMNKEIFPDGNQQIEYEIDQVRKLLDFKYSRDDVKQTYLHAAGLYHISTDRSQNSITKSILLNQGSMVTEIDASKIFTFIESKYLNKLDRSPADLLKSLTKEQQLISLTKGGIVELKKHFSSSELNKAGKYEVILFNSVIVLNKTVNLKVNISADNYFKELIRCGLDEYSVELEGDVLVELINSRMTTYSNELNKISEPNNSYFPLKLFCAFYDKPLQHNIEFTGDLNVMKMLEFNNGLARMIKWVDSGFETVMKT